MAPESSLSYSEEPGLTGSVLYMIPGLGCGSMLAICIRDFKRLGSKTKGLSSILGTMLGRELVLRAVLVGYKIVSNVLVSKL